MASKKINKKDFGFLGTPYQMGLVKCFIEDFKFLESIYDGVDPNVFSDKFRMIVGYIIEQYKKTHMQVTYGNLMQIIRFNTSEEIELETQLGTVKEIMEYDLQPESEVVTKEHASSFFLQQCITKAYNEVGRILEHGEVDKYRDIVPIFSKAMEIGQPKENETRLLYDNLEEALSKDHRVTISTGIPEIDEALFGGLGKGELGEIIAPTNVGKAQPLDAKIITPKGYKLMGDIKIGDEVIGGDGFVHKVSGVYPQGVRDIVGVTFSNGAFVECDYEHLWTVSKDEGKTWETKTTNEIIKDFEENGTHYLIPTVKPITINPIKRGKNEGNSFNGIFSAVMCLEPKKRLEMLLKHIDLSEDNDGNHWEITDDDVKFTTNSDWFADVVYITLKSLGHKCLKETQDDSSCVLKFKMPTTLEDEAQREKVEFYSFKFTRKSLAQCIMVDSEDHTYLTEDFIVTHNTSLCIGLAAAAALQKSAQNNYQGWKVLHYFFEDTDVNIERKYYAYHLSGLDKYKDIDENDANNAIKIDAINLSGAYRTQFMEDLSNENDPIRQMLRKNIRVEHLRNGVVSADDIISKVQKQIAMGFTPDVIFIDYFECIRPERVQSNESEWTREGLVMRKLEGLCAEFNVALWVPIQGNRSSYGAEHVGLSDGGGSWQKSQIAHMAITLARTSEQRRLGLVTVKIEKARGLPFPSQEFRNARFNNGTCRLDVSVCNDIDNLEDHVEETAKFGGA